MAGDIELKVKLKPDTVELKKELDKPFTFKGLFKGLTGFGGPKARREESPEIKGLVGLSAKGIALLASLAGVVASIDFIIKPFLNLFSAVIALLFLPLIPLMIPFLKAVGPGISELAKSSIAVKNIVQKIVDFLFGGGIVDFAKNLFAGVLESIGKAWDLIKGIGKWLFDNIIKPGFNALLGVGKWLFDNIIKKGWNFLKNVGKTIWDTILLPGWNFLKNVGQKIWDDILFPAWSWFGDIGTRIWDLIKGGFSFIKESLRNAANGIINFVNSIIPGTRFDIPNLAAGGIITRPTLAVVGEKGPEAVIPLNKMGDFGGTFSPTININASISNDLDIREVAEKIAEFSKDELARRTTMVRF